MGGGERARPGRQQQQRQGSGAGGGGGRDVSPASASAAGRARGSRQAASGRRRRIGRMPAWEPGGRRAEGAAVVESVGGATGGGEGQGEEWKVAEKAGR